MPPPERPTPENNWLLSDETIEKLRHHYVEERVSVPRAAFRTGITEGLATRILKHNGWMRSPWDRPRHPWSRQVRAAVERRDGTRRL